MEINAMAVTTITIIGPVGILGIDEDIRVPIIPDNPPKKEDNTIIMDSLSVHWRLATAGAINMALIKTTPTLWSPTITAITINVVKSKSNLSVENPIISLKSGSKDNSLNSFQNRITITMLIIATIPIKIISRCNSVEA